MKKIFFFFFILCANGLLYAQMPLHDRLKNHVEYLASEALEGRETGTEGERKAGEYIVNQFSEIGLLPSGTSGYYQPFDFLHSRKLDAFSSRLKIGGNDIQSFEYHILPMSATAEVSGKISYLGFGISAPAMNYDDYKDRVGLKGRVFIIELSSPDGVHPHSKYIAHSGVREKIDLAEKNGASAILFINHDSNLEPPSLDWKKKTSPVGIPVFLLTDVSGTWSQTYCKSLENQNALVKVKIIEERRVGKNVMGWVDGSGTNLIVIGAHYDHLGYGEESSLHRGERAIHNGADDNASGTSVLIELARAIKSTEDSNRSDYLFIAFSGEEMGLLGSSYYVKNPTLPLDLVSCMLNMDMVGRLDSALGLNGYGTSPRWSEMVSYIEKRWGVEKPFRLKTSESGVGPSDHTSFYLKEKPVLHFFTGAHADYHKPGDDIDKVNFTGMEEITTFILMLLQKIDAEDSIPFVKTQDTEPGKAPKFSVTLGIVPDYMFEGPGMRIDGVSDGKPAIKAGIKGGDILLKLGDFLVKDMSSYMSALAKFKKGDKTVAVLMREGKEISLQVEF